jgi:HEAT repeat protein
MRVALTVHTLLTKFIQALGELGVPSNPQEIVKPDLESLFRDLNHGVWEVRRDACEELGSSGDRSAVPHLIRLLGDGVGAVRFAAADALGKIGDKAAVTALLPLIDDPNFGSYGPVIESLANLRAMEAVPRFIRMLSDRDPRVRGLAANALMAMTRQFIGFKAKGSEEERANSIQQWVAWWEKNKNSLH